MAPSKQVSCRERFCNMRGVLFSRLTLLDHEGAKKPEKAPAKESVQDSSSSSSNKDKQPPKPPTQRPLKEEEETVVKGFSKAVSGRERRCKSKCSRY